MEIDKKYIETISNNIDKPICVLDTETSGLSDTDEIISFACIKIHPKNLEYEQLDFKCKPTCKIHEMATKAHGIKDEDLVKEKPFKYYAGKTIDLLSDSYISGFNTDRFDLKILDRELVSCGYKDFFKDLEKFDTFPLYKIHSSRTLTDALAYYCDGEQPTNSHDALADVIVTTKVLAKQIDREKLSISEIIKKLGESGKRNNDNSIDRFILVPTDGNPPILNFSKKKGCLIKDLDDGFVKWMLNADFVTKDAKEALKTIRQGYKVCSADPIAKLKEQAIKKKEIKAKVEISPISTPEEILESPDCPF